MFTNSCIDFFLQLFNMKFEVSWNHTKNLAYVEAQIVKVLNLLNAKFAKDYRYIVSAYCN